MRSVLETLSFAMGVREICQSSTVKEAIESLRNFPADIVITDWHMDPPDGLDFVKFLRTSPNSPNPYVPIIMLTGHGDRDRVITARDTGVNMFMAKPVSARSLYQRVTWIIDNPLPFIRTKQYFGPDRRRQNVGPPEGIAERRQDDQAR